MSGHCLFFSAFPHTVKLHGIVMKLHPLQYLAHFMFASPVTSVHLYTLELFEIKYLVTGSVQQVL